MAVDQVSFDLEAGKVNSIIARTGGQDDAAQPVTGNLRALRGNVTFEGADVTGLAPHLLAARGMARTFQTCRSSSTWARSRTDGRAHLRERAGWLTAMLHPRLAAGERESREEAPS